jgi:hypothetical protein
MYIHFFAVLLEFLLYYYYFFVWVGLSCECRVSSLTCPSILSRKWSLPSTWVRASLCASALYSDLFVLIKYLFDYRRSFLFFYFFFFFFHSSVRAAPLWILVWKDNNSRAIPHRNVNNFWGPPLQPMRRRASLRTQCMFDGRRCIFVFSSAPPLASLIRAWHNGFLLLLHRVSVEVSRQSSDFLPLLVDATFFWLLLIRYTFPLLCLCVCVCVTACASSPHLSARARQFVLLFCVCYFFLSSWLSTLRPFFFSFSFFFLYGVSCQCMWKL